MLPTLQLETETNRIFSVGIQQIKALHGHQQSLLMMMQVRRIITSGIHQSGAIHKPEDYLQSGWIRETHQQVTAHISMQATQIMVVLPGLQINVCQIKK
jgi:hypothetical protein